MMNIYYVIPKFDRFVRYEDDKSIFRWLKRIIKNNRKASGGIQIIYEHCQMLNKKYNVNVLSMGGKFSSIDPDWFEHNCKLGYYKNEIDKIDEATFIVIPEVIPEEVEKFPRGRKFLFVQNWALFKKEYDYSLYEGLISLEGYCAEYIKKYVKLPIFTVRNGINLKEFYYKGNLKEEGRIFLLYRKNQKEIDRFLFNLPKEIYERYNVIVGKKHLDKNELIKEYQKAEIFLSFSYPEGFALPPLEAMACGCVVIGYTGGGGKSHMINGETAIVLEDGDYKGVEKGLIKILGDNRLKSILKKNALLKAKEYSLEAMYKSVENLWHEIGGYYDI